MTLIVFRTLLNSNIYHYQLHFFLLIIEFSIFSIEINIRVGINDSI